MTGLETYQKLKKRAELLKSEISKAEGAYENVMQQIKEQFDCDDLEQAETLAEQLKKQAEEAEQKYNAALDAFNAKWEKKFDSVSDD